MSPWSATGFRFDSISESSLKLIQPKETFEISLLTSGPQILIGYFYINEEIRDTYLDTANWGKGVAFINEHNIGRYWTAGPQMTLYVPGVYLKKGRNSLILVELESVPSNRNIKFRINPILDYQ